MAEQLLPHESGIRPRRDLTAPWSPAPLSIKRDKTRAVVYVIGEDGAQRCKVGASSGLKRRLADLRDQTRINLHTQFWAEFDRPLAFRVERAALILLRDARISQSQETEWFDIFPEDAARAVLEAMRALRANPRSLAGFPGAMDCEPSEIEEVLSEPTSIAKNKGRLGREEWAPQARSITY